MNIRRTGSGQEVCRFSDVVLRVRVYGDEVRADGEEQLVQG